MSKYGVALIMKIIGAAPLFFPAQGFPKTSFSSPDKKH
jgi:hypothetical protein